MADPVDEPTAAVRLDDLSRVRLVSGGLAETLQQKLATAARGSGEGEDPT
jgi:hypothetical protein